MTATKIYFFPLLECSQSVELDRFGAVGDRRFLIVDEANRCPSRTNSRVYACQGRERRKSVLLSTIRPCKSCQRLNRKQHLPWER